MMENLIIESTNKTPEVNLNFQTGVLNLQGISTPEDSFKFYKPIMIWLAEYEHNPAPNTIFNIHLEYFNTSSSKWLLEIFYFFERLSTKTNITINWKYIDEDILETGHDYDSLVNLSFNFIEVND